MPDYSYGGFLGNNFSRPYPPAQFEKRFDNLRSVGQSEVPVLRPSPTITVTGRRESNMGTLADVAVGLTPFGYRREHVPVDRR